MRRGVGLRVEVEDAYALAALGQRRGQVDRRRRLADAALLIDDRNPSHDRTSSVRAGAMAADYTTEGKCRKCRLASRGREPPDQCPESGRSRPRLASCCQHLRMTPTRTPRTCGSSSAGTMIGFIEPLAGSRRTWSRPL